MTESRERWPALPLEEWRETYATLHMYTQVVGKVRLALAPMMNQWWQVPLYVTARGLTTSPMPTGERTGERTCEMLFDFFDHVLVVETSDGQLGRIALGGAVRDFYREVTRALEALGVSVSIWPHPVEVPNPIPFEEDDTHATYDAAQALRFWEVLRRVDVVLKDFRARFTGKASPVHFFWGSFDLATTRFSGRPAPPKPDTDAMTRLAYNAELASVGFWPGGQGVDGAAFYAYAYPEPSGYRSHPVRPRGAFYHEPLGEFLLMYDVVRQASEPRDAILDFAQSTYDAAADLMSWPRAQLERAGPGGAAAAAGHA